jgi:hypothetical protein
MSQDYHEGQESARHHGRWLFTIGFAAGWAWGVVCIFIGVFYI